MMKSFITAFILFISANAYAENVYFLNNLKDCTIARFEEGVITRVETRPFINKILNVHTLPKNPSYVVFKIDEKIYITTELCVVSSEKKEIPNYVNGRENFKKTDIKLSEKEKFNSYKHFIEIEAGNFKIKDTHSVGENYNSIFPSSSTTNPTEWGAAGTSSYQSTSLISIGFGFKFSEIQFLAFKIRLIKGQKADKLDLVDMNTGISETGTWVYKDSFKNFYAGFKYIFLDYSAWKPIIAGYLGFSAMNSELTDGSESFELSSFFPAALIEAGIEYHLNSHWGLGLNLGYEYLGKRTLKFSDNDQEIKTNMSYSNVYGTFGVKYYFK